MKTPYRKVTPYKGQLKSTKTTSSVCKVTISKTPRIIKAPTSIDRMKGKSLYDLLGK